jgi:hypothetical protein
VNEYDDNESDDDNDYNIIRYIYKGISSRSRCGKRYRDIAYDIMMNLYPR